MCMYGVVCICVQCACVMYVHVCLCVCICEYTGVCVYTCHRIHVDIRGQPPMLVFTFALRQDLLLFVVVVGHCTCQAS